MSSTSPFNSQIALIDCNNFFVSCERIFDPSLHKKPVVVLSSNDGCIVSRSNEAKRLQIPMGAPYFKWRDFCEKNNVIVRSSNFALYGDISQRIMEILYLAHSDIEFYSIDEAFLFFHQEKLSLNFFHKLRSQILKWVGIPVSIGVSATKTLAKVAATVAKKKEEGVYEITVANRDLIFTKMPVEEVWGIGWRLSSFLRKKNIKSVFDLVQKEDAWIKKNMSVTGLRTVWELRGICCYSCEEPAPKQSIMTSRSFGQALEKKEPLLNALSHFASKGGEKLRQEKSLASTLDVFIMTSPHKDNFFHDYAHITFPEPTNYTPHLIEAAQKGLDSIFQKGFLYKKGGVLLGGLISENALPLDLFTPFSYEKKDKQIKLMKVMDEVNKKYGSEGAYFGSSQKENNFWKVKSNQVSQAYTTKWDELLTI